MIVQYALATLVAQEVLTTAAAEVYSPVNTTELTRLSLANHSAAEQTATLYHRKKGFTGAVAASEIVGAFTVATMSMAGESSDSPNSSITLQEGDALWAKAKTATSVTLSAYGVARNVAPLPRT